MGKKEIINNVVRFVKETFKDASTGHDWWHTYRVWMVAKTITKEEKADLFIVELGALLHDIADFKFNNGNDKASSKVTKKLLEGLEVELDVIEKVMHIVDNVSFKGAGVKNKINSLEGKIVQDADRLDALGAIGIARVFAYGGYVKSELYNPEIKPTLHQCFEDYKNSNSSSINHFYEKILLLKDMMNTKVGKKMAKKRHIFLEEYLKEFFNEWNGKA